MSATTPISGGLQACPERDHLTLVWFPGTSAGTLRITIFLCAVFAITSFCRLNPALWGHLPAAADVHRVLGSEALILGQALIVTLFVALLLLGVRAWRTRTPLPQAKAAEATGMRTVLAMAIVFTTALVAPPTYALITGQPRGEDQVLVSGTPLYLAEEVARRGIAGNIAAPNDWADYLVWKSHGSLRPLTSAHDCEAIFRGERALDLLAAHDIHFLAASRQRHPELVRLATAETRAANPRLQILYQDQACILVEVVKPQNGG